MISSHYCQYSSQGGHAHWMECLKRRCIGIGQCLSHFLQISRCHQVCCMLTLSSMCVHYACRGDDCKTDLALNTSHAQGEGNGCGPQFFWCMLCAYVPPYPNSHFASNAYKMNRLPVHMSFNDWVKHEGMKVQNMQGMFSRDLWFSVSD